MRYPLIALLLALVALAPAVRGDPPPTPPTNAADVYRQAFEWWTAHARGDGRVISEEEEQLLADGLGGAAPSDAQRAVYEKTKPYLDLIRQASAMGQCDFGLDRSQGFELLLPHLSELRRAARFLRFDADMRMASGDYAGAIESLNSMASVPRQVQGDNILISSLVGGAILSLQDSSLTDLADSGELTPERAEALAKALEKYRGSDPLGLAEAMRGEGEMMRISVERAMASDQAIAGLLSDLGGDGSVLKDLKPEEVRSQLDTAERLYGDLATALANPDRAAAKATIDAISQRIESGEAGLIAQSLMPAVERMAEINWAMIDRVNARLDMLEKIRTGALKPGEVANAAGLYLQIAFLFDGMPSERQAEIEAARIAGGSLDDEAKAKARELVAPFRAKLRRTFESVAACTRCDFAARSRDTPYLLPRYLPGLRAATRAMIADALLGASPDGRDGRVAGSEVAPPSAEEAVAATLRLARHLSIDPSTGHALVAGALLAEAADGIAEARRRKLLDEAALERLGVLLASVDRSDVCGARAGLARDRERLHEAYFGRSRDAASEALAAAIEKRDAQQLAGIFLSAQLHAEVPQIGAQGVDQATIDLGRWSDAGLASPLLGMGDIVAPASVPAAQTMIERLTDLLPALDDPDAMRKAFQALQINPAPCDPTLRAAEATAALARLDELVKVTKPAGGSR